MVYLVCLRAQNRPAKQFELRNGAGPKLTIYYQATDRAHNSASYVGSNVKWKANFSNFGKLVAGENLLKSGLFKGFTLADPD